MAHGTGGPRFQFLYFNGAKFLALRTLLEKLPNRLSEILTCTQTFSVRN